MSSIAPGLLISISGTARTLTVVDELERHRIILLAQRRHHRLQLILAFTRYPHRVPLDLRPQLRELVADQLGDLACQILRDALLQLVGLAYHASARLLQLTRLEDLQ